MERAGAVPEPLNVLEYGCMLTLANRADDAFRNPRRKRQIAGLRGGLRGVPSDLDAVDVRPLPDEKIRQPSFSFARRIDDDRSRAAIARPPAELLIDPIRVAELREVLGDSGRTNENQRLRRLKTGKVQLLPVANSRRGLVIVGKNSSHSPGPVGP